MPLAVLRQPFDDPAWIYELKYDGFRALAYVEGGSCRLVSRNGHIFTRFAELAQSIATAIPGQAVLDGEVVHLGPDGEPQFYELMRHRSPQHFYAFDVLWRNGQDLRQQPLSRRKAMLREIVPARETGTQLLYADHIERDGILLYNLACGRDLEGIVAKRANGLYTPEETSWVKIKNRQYSQNDGRWELFQKRRGKAGG